MSINSATVTAKAIRLKSPSGIFHEANSAIYNVNTSELKFSLSKLYTAADKGLWEIYTAEQNRISDAAGNLLILNEKIGEFVVDDSSTPISSSDPNDISGLKTKQEEQATALQKATQSIADLAILVAKGTGTTGGATSAELTALKDKLTALDTSKAEKTALEALDTSVKALKTALESGATDDELAVAIKKVDDTVGAIQKSLTPLVGRTLYTLATVIDVLAGDSIFIDAEGDIKLPSTPNEGAEITIFDPWRRLKAEKNNVLLGPEDRWLLADGIYDGTTLTFADNQLQGGKITFKYSARTKSWSAYVVYGSPVQIGGQSPITSVADTTETVILSTLLANIWTNIPSLTGQNASKSITDYRVFDGSDEDITTALDSRFINGGWQVRSLSSLSNLKFLLELSGVGTESNSVLSILLANTWTDIPLPAGTTKKIVDYKALTDMGEDITDALESKLMADQWKVRSLVEIKNVQFNLELV